MEERNAMRPEGEERSRVSESSLLLSCFIEAHLDSLMGLLRNYVSRGAIASNEKEVQEEAAVLLHEVYIEALKTSDHFDLTRPPRAWLLGIAGNILKQKRREISQRSQYEVALSDLQQHNQGGNMDLLDRLSMLYCKRLEEEAEMREEVRYLLSLVSEKDRSVLELCYLHGLDGEALALELECSYTAALVRLCRARERLRIALTRAERRAL
jgi:RNA polymerase sigma factor (sigma-70 family)